ncbi:hypothetical protein EIN_145920 [Entamoeba invadens IP1]|uniref:Chitin-binding type-2 domain-containing protein n=1 Tax=Entamoeba invadens IP1 TaxID=370355 RepID=L7FLN2_ENTIV|nr:hypothetical protein EIN_145920 [Entamoeba invadens IP1]ELP87608.1 hypothetical protein EIN_145920 [Entamoeba invadens IP1]|eukprot:XP_004254379.1 hypothetical protein EIN_145920 [Entamoeba invadens IP1]
MNFKSMQLLLLLTAVLVSGTPCDQLEDGKAYTVTDAFECIESITRDSTWTTTIQTGLQKLFETYAFKDILKNPPQPAFNSSFYRTIDIDQRLKELPIDEQSVYKFMQSVQAIVNEASDYHLSFRLTSDENNLYYYDEMYAVLPFILDIVNGDEVIVYPNDVVEKFGLSVPEGITDNVNVPVQSINGLEPLQWIRKFAEEQTFLKTPHGRFTYAVESMNYMSLQRTLMTKEALDEKIKIVYTSGNEASTEYMIAYVPIATKNITSERIERLKDKLMEKHGVNILRAEDFVESNLKEDNSYDYESKDANLACKTFETQKVNIMVLKTFYPEDFVPSFFKTLNTCIKQFDTNEYPISLILPMNGGGLGDLVASLEDVFAPQGDSSMIGAVRISDGSVGVIKSSYGMIMDDTETCEMRYNVTGSDQPLGEWYTNAKTVKYGDVEHTHSQESFVSHVDMIKEKLVNHPRKPTDFVVFTDGFCYSACSVFAKGMADRGNAIVVGFEGDPEGTIEEFDAGNSPTAVVTQDDTQMPEVTDPLKSLGGLMRISFLETFRWNFKFTETTPREFIMNVVDERTDIFRFGENKLGQFADETLRIYTKYKTQCNPKNKRLLKYDSACDSAITIAHAHGGYVCGDDGLWSTVCAAGYCDDGFKWDFYNQECVVDVCAGVEPSSSNEQSSEMPSPSSTTPVESSTTSISSSEEKDKTTEWIIIGVCSGIFLLIIIVGVCGIVGFVIYRKKTQRSEYTALG